MLANVGCEIFAMEKHPVVAALLRDTASGYEPLTHLGVNVSNSGTPTALRMFGVSHGVVYLDPMFPNERRAAPS